MIFNGAPWPLTPTEVSFSCERNKRGIAAALLLCYYLCLRKTQKVTAAVPQLSVVLLGGEDEDGYGEAEEVVYEIDLETLLRGYTSTAASTGAATGASGNERGGGKKKHGK